MHVHSPVQPLVSGQQCFPPQARAHKAVISAAVEQGFTYEAQWQVAAAAALTAAVGWAPVSRALLLQLTAADGSQTVLGVTAGTTAAQTLENLGSRILAEELRLAAPFGRSARHGFLGVPRYRAAGQGAAAAAAPRLAALALQALQHFAVDAAGRGPGAAAVLESVSLSTHGERSAGPHM
jgi:hypothetical protein